jgi:HEAT repeat protein
MPTSRGTSDTPRLDQGDSVELRKNSHPFSFNANPDSPLNEQIVEAINRMGGGGENAEAAYQSSLDVLRRQAKKVISTVAVEYNELPEDQYLDRWSLVQLLAELKDAAALPALDEILSSPIPPERSKETHSFSTVGEEVMIRTTAIEAVTRIAGKNKQALEILLKHTQHKNFSVKRAAIQGYLEQGGKDAREALLKSLPKKDHYILDIRRMDVREVPQAEGGLFLARRDREDLSVPPLSDRSEERK